MGAIKAGVSVVTFDEKESIDALAHALKSTKAKGLIFSSDTLVGEKQTRADNLAKLMPELSKMYFGDELNLKSYQNLKQIV